MLPATEATEFLRANFGEAEDHRLLERWVDDSVGLSDRSDCLGSRAIELALGRLAVGLTVDHDLLFDGELRLVSGKPVIFLRETADASRRAFTVAHELGHAALFSLEPSLEQKNPDVERLCNLFAAELLMPRVHL